MAFIRFRNVKYDENGNIRAGTAAIIESSYSPGGGRSRSRQIVRERLGKIVEILSDKCGLFNSPTRGLVMYNAEKDCFSSVLSKEELLAEVTTSDTVNKIFPENKIHTIFGDVYLFLEQLKKTELLNIIANCTKEKIFVQRVLCHVLHTILRDGCKITCDDFIAKSFLSYCVKDVPLSTLKSDTRYFNVLGDDKFKIQFFSRFIKKMKKQYPNFGSGCFIDSTPLPNDINSPFSSLCSHGLSSTSIQMRLILILDECTLYPLWFSIIPGNLQDVNTIKNLLRDVRISLDVEIKNFVLDAGYVSKELIESFVIQNVGEPIPERHYLARMPAKKGYPYKILYNKIKEFISKKKYAFIRNGRPYFGKLVDTAIFNMPVKTYVFVDHYRALQGFTDFVENNPDEYEKLTNKEKDWYGVKYGYFILVGNYIKEPAEILKDYFCRTSIETVFKTDKEYLKLLPLCKWNQTTIQGKILNDIICSIFRQKILENLKNSEFSLTALIGKCQALMCCMDLNENKIYIEYPTKQVKILYKNFSTIIPRIINLNEYLNNLFEANSSK